MKASVADAAGMVVSPTGAACDIRAPIYFGRSRERVTSRPPVHQLPIRHGHNV